MTGRIIAAAALLAAVTGACGGASSKEVTTARTAAYDCDQRRVLDALVESMREQFPPNAGVNPGTGAVITDLVWYDRYGSRIQEGEGVGEGAVMIGAEAALRKGEKGGWMVLARARVFGHEVGSPRGQEYSEKDSRWPTWVTGKIDKLFLKIHGKLVPGCPNLNAGIAQ